uniref:Uncharacterized protein n=1 Tax=Anguilla anguilla TaxID=7936 RepID=A0A0E9VXV9_ANGAN
MRLTARTICFGRTSGFP